jgi:hypothetical protein
VESIRRPSLLQAPISASYRQTIPVYMNRCDILPVSILIAIVIIASLLLAAPYIFPPGTESPAATAEGDLSRLTSGIAAALTSITESTGTAAKTLSTADRHSAAEVQPVLDDLASTSGYALSYAFIVPNGTIIAVAPEMYAGSLGVNIAAGEPGAAIIGMREPFLSDAFVAQEGFTGIEIACPVLSSDGDYLGSVITMAEPSAIVGEMVAPMEAEHGITVTVMQPDGFILYDRDPAQVGKNLFSDLPFTDYPSLQALGKRIAADTAGNGAYTFYASPEKTGDTMQKQADWDTVAYLGKEWRIIVFRDETGA